MADKTTKDADDEAQVRPFADWLREQARGHSHEELSQALHDLVARCRDTGRKGTLTYTVTVVPENDKGILVVGDEIKLKLPEHDRAKSLFWADRHGNLTRRDPNQHELDLPLRVVDHTTGEIKEQTK